jgi:hypothetical protein
MKKCLLSILLQLLLLLDGIQVMTISSSLRARTKCRSFGNYSLTDEAERACGLDGNALQGICKLGSLAGSYKNYYSTAISRTIIHR